MSKYNSRENLDRLLAERPPRRPTPLRPNSPNNLDPRANVVQGLLLRIDRDAISLLRPQFGEILDVDRESGAVVVVVSADDLHDFASGDDSESSENDGDGDVLVDRIVLEVDLAVLGEDVCLGFTFVS